MTPLTGKFDDRQSVLHAALAYPRELGGAMLAGWQRFWFTPVQPHTYCLIRVLAGLMLLYTHLVWTLGLQSFMGDNAWITADGAASFQAGSYAGSYLWLLNSPAALWAAHIVALVVFALFTLGLWTRVTSILAWFITLNYCHRLPGALYGLDQINVLLAMYLMIGPSGALYSLDRLRQNRRRKSRGEESLEVSPSIAANIGLRLIQLHLCVIYFFSAIGKVRGLTWSSGWATWYTAVNYEYQTFDLTWLGQFPILMALLTHATVFWELTYCVLIWPRWTRPLMLLMAVCVHGTIGLAMGMWTFGLVMLIANVAFIPPELTRALLGPKLGREPIGTTITGAGEGSRTSSPSNDLSASREAVQPRRRIRPK